MKDEKSNDERRAATLCIHDTDRRVTATPSTMNLKADTNGELSLLSSPTRFNAFRRIRHRMMNFNKLNGYS